MELGRVGVWSGAFASMPTPSLRRIVPEIESLGFRTLWYPESFSKESFSLAAVLLAAGSESNAATGIANMWARDPTAMVNGARTLSEAFPDRFLLGIGVSHRPAAVKRGGEYRRPYTMMVEYLNAMDEALYTGPRPHQEPPLVLAALGARMLALAAERSWGAHPYFVPIEHTAMARSVMGPDALLAPEQAFVLSQSADKARGIARDFAALYLGLPNYTNNLLRLGWRENDLADGGSDALIDAIIPWGDAGVIRHRVEAHLAAGADHVAVQVLNGKDREFPIDEWTEIAAALNDI
jgi:probable F420-dependent oxidoreductase